MSIGSDGNVSLHCVSWGVLLGVYRSDFDLNRLPEYVTILQSTVSFKASISAWFELVQSPPVLGRELEGRCGLLSGLRSSSWEPRPEFWLGSFGKIGWPVGGREMTPSQDPGMPRGGPGTWSHFLTLGGTLRVAEGL